MHAALKNGAVFGKAPRGHSKLLWAEVRAAGCEVLGHLFHYDNHEQRQEEGNPGHTDSDAMSALLTLIDAGFKDKDELVRLQAVIAAGKLRLCEALTHLIGLIQDSSPLVVEAVINAIGETTPSPSGVEVRFTLLSICSFVLRSSSHFASRRPCS